MTPEQWIRMSWHARHRYIARINAERARRAQPDYLHIPDDITETRDIARWIYLHLKADPPEVIRKRQDLLEELTPYTRGRKCSTSSQSAA